jgi:Protein of unknown function (DUF692)/Transposase, Mutator family
VGEADFVAELLERTDSLLLLDVSNIHANARNHGLNPFTYLDSLPLHRLAYVHVGSGVDCEGICHDTHAHGVDPAVLDLLEELPCGRRSPGGCWSGTTTSLRLRRWRPSRGHPWRGASRRIPPGYPRVSPRRISASPGGLPPAGFDAVLAVGDGALGFPAALREVFTETREQRCWVHKAANMLNCLPKSAQHAETAIAC